MIRHCHLRLARPYLYVAHGLLLSSLLRQGHSFLGLAAKVNGNSVSNWTTKTLTGYYMRSYIACMSLATSQIHRISRPKRNHGKVYHKDHLSGRHERVSWFLSYMPEICSQLVVWIEENMCSTHILSNPNIEFENNLTILKDQFCRVERCFEELTILNEYVHTPKVVPGVVGSGDMKTHGNFISPLPAMLHLVGTGLSRRCRLPCKTDKRPVHGIILPVALKGSRDVGPARSVRTP